jgi:glycerate kinase
MRVIIAPDKFKHSLSSLEVCHAIERGIKLVYPDAECLHFPMADGGDGLLEVLSTYVQVEKRSVEVRDPLGKLIQTSYLLAKDGSTAFIEMAQASGLQLLKPEEYNCAQTNTYGTGQLILDAVNCGVNEIILGIGGSATNDGGMGMAKALGYDFLDAEGRSLYPCGANLIGVHAIQAPGQDLFERVQVRVVCDVENPLTGLQGASRVYAAQKGADLALIDELEQGMQHYAQVLKATFHQDVDQIPGAGAAGGLGAGGLVFLHAQLQKGADLVIERSGLAAALEGTDWVITGEGKLDAQTLHGKLIAAISSLANSKGIPLMAFCGSLDLTDHQLAKLGIRHAYPILKDGMAIADAMQNADGYLTERVTEAFACFSKDENFR